MHIFIFEKICEWRVISGERRANLKLNFKIIREWNKLKKKVDH